MRFSHKVLLNFILIAVVLILFYAYHLNESKQKAHKVVDYSNSAKHIEGDERTKKFSFKQKIESSMVKFSPQVTSATWNQNEYNVWCIFSKASHNSQLKQKFDRFALSLLKHSTVFLKLHLIVDDTSKIIAEGILRNIKISVNRTFEEHYYKVNDLADKLQDIISSMQPHFSSQPGSYYSDALFFLSLGLHRIAKEQERAIMFDADTKILADVAILFKEFEKFNKSTLFGLVPELSPVYRHVLYSFRSKYKNTVFGDPIDKGGFPGVNSGVIMFQLEHIRNSKIYNDILNTESVSNLTAKYLFKGHLGDQDFYTILGMEHPSMIHILGCEWNRQLCKWWKTHGYQDIFDEFFRCEKQVKIYHGNCNSVIPNSNFFPL